MGTGHTRGTHTCKQTLIYRNKIMGKTPHTMLRRPAHTWYTHVSKCSYTEIKIMEKKPTHNAKKANTKVALLDHYCDVLRKKNYKDRNLIIGSRS